jgi:hypothetical protein
MESATCYVKNPQTNQDATFISSVGSCRRENDGGYEESLNNVSETSSSYECAMKCAEDPCCVAIDFVYDSLNCY